MARTMPPGERRDDSGESQGRRRNHSRRRLSDAGFVIPFGHYQGTRRAAHPASELLVGREGQRAYFLNLLYSLGRRGAFLVTGHRGSGKTTFVRYCLEEYRRNLFRRYLNSNVGRTVFWDRLIQVGVAALAIFFLLLLTQLLQLVLSNGVQSLEWYDWLVVLTIGFGFILVPFLEAWEILRMAVPCWLNRSRLIVPRILRTEERVERVGGNATGHEQEGWWIGFWTFLLLMGVIVLSWCFLPLGEPSVSVTWLLLLIATLYLGTVLFSTFAETEATPPWRTPYDDDPSCCNELRPPRDCRQVLLRWLPLLVFSVLILGAVASVSQPPPDSESHSFGQELALFQGLTAALLAGVGAGVRVFDQCKLMRHLEPRSERHPWLFQALRAARNRHRFGFLLGFGLWAVGSLASQRLLECSEFFMSSPANGVIWGTLVLGLVLRPRIAKLQAAASRSGGQEADENPGSESSIATDSGVIRTLPRPLVVLAAKALCLIAVGLQLLFPLAALAPTGITGPDGSAELLDFDPLQFSLLASQVQRSSGLFTHPGDQLTWIIGLVLVLLGIVALEYEHIVRPRQPVRDDSAIRSRSDFGPWSANVQAHFPSFEQHRARQELEHTYFWRVTRAWLPLLVVPVNLGVDRLEYRRVIEAMLMGLRQEYRRCFLSWSSSFPVARRALLLGLVAVAAVWLGDHWFGVKTAQVGTGTEQEEQADSEAGTLLKEAIEERRFCAQLGFGAGRSPREQQIENRKEAPAALYMTCAFGGERALQALQWVPFSATERRSDDDESDGTEAPLLMEKTLGIDSYRLDPLELRTYHGLVFLALLFGSVFAARRAGVLPYRQMNRRMGELLDSLTSKVSQEDRPEGYVPDWAARWTLRARVLRKEGGPYDPRTVELTFLRILRDVQDPSIQIPLATGRRISPPIPEVVFVFDELDKVGVRSFTGPEDGATPFQDREPLDEERERSRELHRLFADLKNILSSGEARFVFIGGRNLHDEWLADQSARYPLLTNIFQGEIYVPSLLTDKLADIERRADERSDGTDARRTGLTPPCEDRGLEGVANYLKAHLQRAQRLHGLVQRRRLAPWATLEAEVRFEPEFTAISADPADEDLPKPEVLSSDPEAALADGEYAYRSIGWRDRFLNDFYRFLAYRSLGSVKRLRELLERQLRIAHRALHGFDEGTPTLDCEHVLSFSDVDLYRIQLTADIHKQLAPVLETRMIFRDDKLTQGALYLADFLLKFHGRAFSWSNLERVDELVHIHRAPELRDVLHQIVVSWSGRYLQIIRNGMYDYRFQSDFANEVTFVSRASEQELAAFNFTLDESQALKRLYRSRCETSSDLESFEFVAGLAELHEFDEEYEVARYQYRRAIRQLDDAFNQDVTAFWDRPMSYRVFAGDKEGSGAARRLSTWAVVRVRLMLQVAMTYEATNDLEHAQVEYRNARTLADAVIQAMLKPVSSEDWVELWKSELKELLPFEPPAGDLRASIGTLKHLNILFQPAFAEAWLAEKTVSGVDTGPALVEQELWRLRLMLPFVNPEEFRDAASDGPRDLEHRLAIRHSNFALLLAELHNRAGALYFIKGRQVAPAGAPEQASKGSEGYLLQAQIHYALSLHEIRHFNAYRRHESQQKFNPREEGSWPTIVEDEWTDFVLRLAADGLSDLAEAQLALVSLDGLVRDPSERAPRQGCDGSAQDPGTASDLIHHFVQSVRRWLQGAESDQWGKVRHRLESFFPRMRFELRKLEDWLGSPPRTQRKSRVLFLRRFRKETERRKKMRLLDFPAAEVPTDGEILVISLLSYFVSADLLETAGYRQAAARVHVRIADTVASFLWVLCAKRFAEPPNGGGEDPGLGCPPIEAVTPFLKLAVHGLSQAQELTGQIRAHRLSEELANTREADLVLYSLMLAILALYPDPNGTTTLRCLSNELPLPSKSSSTLSLRGDLLAKLGACRCPQAAREVVRIRLRKHLQRHSFPVLHRLRGLKVLLDDAVLGLQDSQWTHDIPTDLKDLLSFEERYDGELHFTPFALGVTEALVALEAHKQGKAPEGPGRGGDWIRNLRPEVAQLRDLARTHLHRSQQMYTMGRAYYEVISDMYYLYDDFNDRLIHGNHAMQMAGSELTTRLLKALESSPTHGR